MHKKRQHEKAFKRSSESKSLKVSRSLHNSKTVDSAERLLTSCKNHFIGGRKYRALHSN